MKRTYLITGGAGFIASHLIDRLIDNANIVCVDDFNDFYSPSIKRNNIKNHLNHPNYKLYEVNIVDHNQLKKVFELNNITHIIHLAARAGVRPSLLEPRLYTQTNITGTVNLLELAKEFGVKKFVFGSSSSVYGSRKDGPFHEEMNINKPISPYAATKAAGEQICYTYNHLYNMNIVCLRFFTVYGPRQRPDLAIHKFSRLIQEGKPIPVFGDGSTKRDYTYIDDILQGILASIEYDKTNFEVINLGESQTIELDYLINLLEENLQKKAIIERLPLQPGDVPITYADISKARSLLNYNPTTPIEEGLKSFTKWFNEYYSLTKL
ncbi:MAG: epimerase [Candidatus Melainabacteria bacterium RIFOXYA12_FULL_32_12]|nr:MAG: epimerase [Candidatus Melainabacteria bacterium RIFOXYA12_FULL_32_12]